MVGLPGEIVMVGALFSPRVRKTIAAAAPAAAPILSHGDDHQRLRCLPLSTEMLVVFIMVMTTSPNSFPRDAVTRT